MDFFKNFEGEFVTTEPVLTETVYLLGPYIKQQKLGIEFILKGGALLAPQSLDSLSRVLSLMDKYRDVPMDLADATLVVLGEEMGISEIFTLDHRRFHSYRLGRNKSFKIWPQ